MRKYYWPLAMLGLGGIGAMLLTPTGRRSLRRAAEHLQRAPETLMDWNEAAQRELERIQTALKHVAEMLDTAKTR